MSCDTTSAYNRTTKQPALLASVISVMKHKHTYAFTNVESVYSHVYCEIVDGQAVL